MPEDQSSTVEESSDVQHSEETERTGVPSPKGWKFFVGCMMLVGVVVTTMFIGEMIATVVLYQLPPNQFGRFASVRQLERRYNGNFQFSYQPGFGIYPTPGYSHGMNKHNRLGFRGDDIAIPKPKGVFRIVCFGGSTTYDSEIEDYSLTYPAEIQNLLRGRGYQVEVVNAGCPSWTTREQILNYATRVSYLDADLVVINDGLNDLVLRATWPPEQLRSDYSNPNVFAPDFAKQPWYESLTLLRFPLILSGRLTPVREIDPYWCDTIKSQGAVNVLTTFGPDWLNGLEGNRPNIPAGKTLRDVFDATPANYFAKNLAAVVTLAQKAHQRVLLLSFILNWEGLRMEAADHGEGLAYGAAQMNGLLAAAAKENNEMFFDLARHYPDNKDYWAEFLHNNEAGALFKAGLIADFIVDSGLVPST